MPQTPTPSTQHPSSTVETNPALLASIINTAEDAILVLDPNLNIILFNPAAEKVFGVPKEEILGKPLDRFLPSKMVQWHNGKIRSMNDGASAPHHMGLTHEVMGIRANGERFPIEASLSVFETGGERYYTAIIRDITSRKVIEKELRFISTHDQLTGLFNRMYFEEQLDRLNNGRSYPISIVIADVDGLKRANDTYGHAQGDELLRATARLLKSSFRTEDIIARLGGDEFGVILPQSNEEITLEAVERIYNNLTGLANDSALPFSLSVSIGFATANRNDDIEAVVRLADRRMYQHKAGKAHRRID